MPSVFENVTDVENIPIIENNGKVITLKDLVTLRRTFKDRDSFSRVNGKDAVTLSVMKRQDAKEVVAAKKVNYVLDDFVLICQLEWKLLLLKTEPAGHL